MSLSYVYILRCSWPMDGGCIQLYISVLQFSSYIHKFQPCTAFYTFRSINPNKHILIRCTILINLMKAKVCIYIKSCLLIPYLPQVLICGSTCRDTGKPAYKNRHPSASRTVIYIYHKLTTIDLPCTFTRPLQCRSLIVIFIEKVKST